jgi:hypothetical protein
MGTHATMYDIFFISDNTPSVEYKKLKSRFPFLKLVSSFKQAQEKSLTDFFWVVWDDLIINDNFNFDYVPDKWSKNYIHIFLNSDCYDGIVLVPKNRSFSHKEIKHRFFVDYKKVEIVASKPKPFEIFIIEDYADYIEALKNTKTEMFWMVSNNLTYNKEYLQDFYISHYDSYNRNENHAFVHLVNSQKLYNGVFLLSKNKTLSKREIDYRYLVSRKEWDVVISGPVCYDVFEVNTYDDYLYAMEHSKTEMFWATHASIKILDDFEFVYFSHDNDYDRSENHAFKHRINEKETYNGLFLLSKKQPVTEREILYRFLVNSKEWNIVASEPKKYDIFYTSTYEDYLYAMEHSKTEMFWIIPNHVIINSGFDFNYYIELNDMGGRTKTHVFKNGEYNDGIMLCTKHRKLSLNEYESNYVSVRIDVPIKASNPKQFDVVFISYNEPNADENYTRLKEKAPAAKRIHGVKGIHQAHIEAAKICATDMFWVVDGDASIVDEFEFCFQVPKWEFDTVHVWRSVNPINNLTYGYGGVKLLPKKITINMSTNKPDMTTSISSKFKVIDQISNITVFDTDPFSVWKSAFRECAKLASKTIDRQKNDETDNRLNIWCTVGADTKFGKYSIDGANMGRDFAIKNKNNLKKINDFIWLKKVFNDTYK